MFYASSGFFVSLTLMVAGGWAAEQEQVSLTVMILVGHYILWLCTIDVLSQARPSFGLCLGVLLSLVLSVFLAQVWLNSNPLLIVFQGMVMIQAFPCASLARKSWQETRI